jgi:biotin carboxyl carrier protein
MKQYRIRLEGHAFDVKVLDDPRQKRVQVEVDGEAFTVEVEAVPFVEETAPAVAVPAGALTSAPERASTSGGTVTAPLPGVIKSISVRPGQQVASNDELLVIEAMKMDNVIRAAYEGIVRSIHVAEGRQVAYGAPLLEIDREDQR